MLLRPIDPYEDHQPSSRFTGSGISPEEIGGALMDQCSYGTTSHEPSALLADRRGHDLNVELKALGLTVLTLRLAEKSPSHELMQTH
jgi:hypothetical protein